MDAAHRAYDNLLGRIQRGELVSGRFLVEAEIARELGMSRTPVREALRRLAAEGLVQLADRRRAMVREIEDGEIAEIYELRSRLEGYACRRAATRVTREQIETLEGMQREMEQHARIADAAATARFADLNDRFHHLLLEAAEAPHLRNAVKPLLNIQLLLLQRYRSNIAEHLQRSCWHHREILRALELRDADLAEAQMALHMKSAHATA